jgi:hypothetical protein
MIAEDWTPMSRKPATKGEAGATTAEESGLTNLSQRAKGFLTKPAKSGEAGTMTAEDWMHSKGISTTTTERRKAVLLPRASTPITKGP